ncbi:hypothetical protein [Endozoicomonas ascidiicola]|uniref:hypothetical protein n=1 Tax=Endozoicomonas ascidiicola TaxID=1698521 RepID=UPI000836D899|nr:hypothetical protein [Endozoicomonas ascidiicola]
MPNLFERYNHFRNEYREVISGDDYSLAEKAVIGFRIAFGYKVNEASIERKVESDSSHPLQQGEQSILDKYSGKITHHHSELSADEAFKEHSLSATKVNQSPSSYFFTNNDLSKQQVIDQQYQKLPPESVICIRSPEDLETSDLMQTVWLENGQLKNAQGRIYQDKPLTLIFDLTAMTPGDIAGFNDMAPRSLVWISSRNISDNSGRFYLCEVVSYHGWKSGFYTRSWLTISLEAGWSESGYLNQTQYAHH